VTSGWYELAVQSALGPAFHLNSAEQLPYLHCVGYPREQPHRTVSRADMAGVGNLMPSIHMDCTRLPLICVTLSGDVTDEDFNQYIIDSNAVVAAEKRYILLYEALREARVSPRSRSLQANWIKMNEAALRKLCIGSAFCFASSLTRGALTAVLWMTKLPFEYTVLGNRQQAMEWVQERLHNANMAIPGI